MTKVLAIFTCYNRKEKTKRCLESLIQGNPSLSFTFLAVDDASTDGTREMLEQMKEIEIIKGDGNLFYSGGMRKGIETAKMNVRQFQYGLLFNDDVLFFSGAIERLIALHKNEKQILVGATCDESGKLSYGGVKKTPGFVRNFIQFYLRNFWLTAIHLMRIVC